jgi:hypothetical protein
MNDAEEQALERKHLEEPAPQAGEVIGGDPAAGGPRPLQIGDRVRTPQGWDGVVQAVLDPTQVHVLLGEGGAPSIQAYGSEELTRLPASAALESQPYGYQDAERGGPKPEAGAGEGGEGGEGGPGGPGDPGDAPA